ncbi:MCE family protein [Mycolicibacterium sp. P9-22]|uniref:MCE family protein n=1 Tax=Mycolicibacterium sp. P9-22 TaxID=2024613 RepID=UPI0011EF668C|nr:MCE family protein [Mycolicibacterium sp. P9-22]KAA0120652.1 MCE family protein [Mycolicibacterium sp. P9-22]
MKDNLRGAVTGFAAFVIVCLVSAFVLVAIFGQLRFDPQRTYLAVFTDVTGLEQGDFVRIAGVEVGKVQKISISSDARAVVEFSADPAVVLTAGTKAAVRWADPIGTRYMSLLDGPGAATRLDQGGTIPVERTEPALDLDTLLGGFRPLFRALDPEQVNALSAQLIQAFQGEGATIGSFLAEAAAVTTKLADRDDLIGEVITNLDKVMATLGGESKQVAKAVDSLSQVIGALAARKTDISNAIAHTNASSAGIADLLERARPPFKETVTQSDRTTSVVLADHDYFDDLLNTLPDAYRTLSRLGLNGDYFSFYLCDLLLKVNGKGGQPVYIKVAGQDSGRCAPR